MLVAGFVAGCSSPDWHPVSVSTLPVAPPAEKPSHPEPSKHDEHRAPPPTATPIAGDLPTDLAGVLEVDLACADKPCALDEANPPKGAKHGEVIAFSASLTKPKSKLTLGRFLSADAYGVVISGAVKLRGTEEGAARAVPVWTAFHVPGGGADLVGDAAGSHVVIVVVPRASDGKTLPKAWKTRPSAIETANLASLPDLAWLGGALHARTAFEGDKETASLGVLLASQDAPVPKHSHDSSIEILLALRGDGVLHVGEPAADTAVKDGSILVIPKATPHAWSNAGTKPLVAIQLYTPPGPEQRFKALANPAK